MVNKMQQLCVLHTEQKVEVHKAVQVETGQSSVNSCFSAISFSSLCIDRSCRLCCLSPQACTLGTTANSVPGRQSCMPDVQNSICT